MLPSIILTPLTVASIVFFAWGFCASNFNFQSDIDATPHQDRLTYKFIPIGI